jgi:hypothetical protein
MSVRAHAGEPPFFDKPLNTSLPGGSDLSLGGHHRRRPNRFAITDSGSGRAVCGAWASSL